ncbi:hypothetical protein ACPL7H_11985, partial [Pseudactinotalea sp. Z1732]
PVLGFAIVYLRGRWVSGKFSLGSVTGIIAIVATVWVVLQLVNIAWPRAVNDLPVMDWSIVIGAAVLTILGLIAYMTVRRNIPDMTGVEVTDDQIGEEMRPDGLG